MKSAHLSEKAEKYLQRLCLEIPNRCVGSKGNRAATEIFAEGVASFGFKTECPEFDCVDWTNQGARLTVNHEPFDVFVSPYSLGCHLSAPLAVVSTVEKLETVEAANKIILARGNIAKEQLMPKSFPFYNPDEHKRIIHLLETKAPLAIIAATSRNPELAGGLYPFPLIEDGDFDIPSVYMTEEEGNKLIKHAGKASQSGSLQEAIEEAEKIAQRPRTFLARQFSNINNIKAQEKTGEEILRQIGVVDAVVAGIGTGGTLMGISNVLKKANPELRRIAVEPEEAAVMFGGSDVRIREHKIQGIGDGFIPKLVEMSNIDEVVTISSEAAIDMARRLSKEYGLMVGISSGANMSVALEIAKRIDMDTVVTVLPDRAERYLSMNLF